MFPISRRRRNVLLACGAVAAGGYVTYRIYQSRKRLRVFVFFESFSTLLDVLAQGSNTFTVVFRDLHGFLVSEEDEVPQTIKQLLKLARSSEAQDSISALSAAVSRGLLSTLTSSGSIAERRKPSAISRVSTPRGVSGDSEETKNVIELGASTSLDDRSLSPDDDENVSGVLDVDASSSAGVLLDGVKAQVDSSIARGTKEALQEGLGVESSGNNDAEIVHSGKEHLVDRLAEKLFSESGKGFASAVVASASRSFVNSVLEHINDAASTSRTEGGGEVVKGLVAFARSADGRAVLTDCIQTFVGTAVSVYLDRTKDINTFDELAASLGNPEHQGPITDLVTSICEASTRSFVRTSHEVLTSDPSSSSKQVTKATVSSCPDFGELFHDNEGSEVFYDMGEQEPLSPSQSPVKWKGKTIVQGRRGTTVPSNNYMEQISKVIAVPSNRKLILEIAGTMTSSAVRSTIDVSLGKVSAAFSGNKGRGEQASSKDEPGYEAPRRSGVGEKLQAVGDATKAVMDKSVVLMTMCFAVCLHSVMGGVRLVQPF